MTKITTPISEARFIGPSYASGNCNVRATPKPLNLLRSLTSVIVEKSRTREVPREIANAFILKSGTPDDRAAKKPKSLENRKSRWKFETSATYSNKSLKI
jgi:hypothetical protein